MWSCAILLRADAGGGTRGLNGGTLPGKTMSTIIQFDHHVPVQDRSLILSNRLQCGNHTVKKQNKQTKEEHESNGS